MQQADLLVRGGPIHSQVLVEGDRELGVCQKAIREVIQVAESIPNKVSSQEHNMLKGEEAERKLVVLPPAALSIDQGLRLTGLVSNKKFKYSCL